MKVLETVKEGNTVFKKKKEKKFTVYLNKNI